MSSGEEEFVIDRYGFKMEKFVAEALKNMDMKKEAGRVEKWRYMLDNWDEFVKKKGDKLKERVRKGIPDRWRAIVWKKLLAFDNVRESYKDVKFAELLLGDTEAEEYIGRDLGRTFTDHVDFEVDQET
jgi:hypothetical protein